MSAVSNQWSAVSIGPRPRNSNPLAPVGKGRYEEVYMLTNLASQLVIFRAVGSSSSPANELNYSCRRPKIHLSQMPVVS